MKYPADKTYWMFGSTLIVFFLVGLTLLPSDVHAQEFNCEVSINDRQISGNSYEYVTQLADDLERYINENRWTDDRFEEQERIKCQIQIILTNVDSQFNYTAEAVFSLRRPIYNTIQESSLIILNDRNWVFHYPRGKSLIFDDLQFDDLTSFIDFYMYVLLGYDYDSFSERGGTRYFNKALEILELAQTTNNPGWGRTIGSQRNRNSLINDLTSSGYNELRMALYRYHRLGLDQFTVNPDEARKMILEAIQLIQESKRRASRNYPFDLFFDTKYREIVSVFREAETEIRLEAYNLLRETNPSHSSEYEQLLN